MNKLKVTFSIVFFSSIFCSCNGVQRETDNCSEKFKKARETVYRNPENKDSLEVALNITKDLLSCEDVKIAVIDFRISLFASLKKYDEGIIFVKSVSSKDFTYPYKRQLFLRNFEVQSYAEKGDTVARNNIYAHIVKELEQYINDNKLSDKEFDEVFLDLYSIKENFVDKTQIVKEIDSLKIKYPEKASFFSFFY